MNTPTTIRRPFTCLTRPSFSIVTIRSAVAGKVISTWLPRRRRWPSPSKKSCTALRWKRKFNWQIIHAASVEASAAIKAREHSVVTRITFHSLLKNKIAHFYNRWYSISARLNIPIFDAVLCCVQIIRLRNSFWAYFKRRLFRGKNQLWSKITNRKFSVFFRRKFTCRNMPNPTRIIITWAHLTENSERPRVYSISQLTWQWNGEY